MTFMRSVSPFLPICILFIVQSIIQVEQNVLSDAITSSLPELVNVYVATLRYKRENRRGKQTNKWMNEWNFSPQRLRTVAADQFQSNIFKCRRRK